MNGLMLEVPETRNNEKVGTTPPAPEQREGGQGINTNRDVTSTGEGRVHCLEIFPCGNFRTHIS